MLKKLPSLFKRQLKITDFFFTKGIRNFFISSSVNDKNTSPFTLFFLNAETVDALISAIFLVMNSQMSSVEKAIISSKVLILIKHHTQETLHSRKLCTQENFALKKTLHSRKLHTRLL